jgi:hypothetical protein
MTAKFTFHTNQNLAKFFPLWCNTGKRDLAPKKSSSAGGKVWHTSFPHKTIKYSILNKNNFFLFKYSRPLGVPYQVIRNFKMILKMSTCLVKNEIEKVWTKIVFRYSFQNTVYVFFRYNFIRASFTKGIQYFKSVKNYFFNAISINFNKNDFRSYSRSKQEL